MSDPGSFPIPELEEPAPADAVDPVVEVYKRDIDRTLLRENLKLSVAERLEKFQDFMDFIAEARGAGRRAGRDRSPASGR